MPWLFQSTTGSLGIVCPTAWWAHHTERNKHHTALPCKSFWWHFHPRMKYIWSIPAYAIWSVIVLTFQITAEINLNSINSLSFSGKSKKISLKLSHHDHSDRDMVDGVTLLIKTQNISKRGCEALSMRQLLCTKIQGCCKWEIEVNYVLLFWWIMKTSLRKRTLFNVNFFSKLKNTLSICPSCVRCFTLYSVSVIKAIEKRGKN